MRKEFYVGEILEKVLVLFQDFQDFAIISTSIYNTQFTA